MVRVALFALVGALFPLYWALADPSHNGTESLTEWRYVLLFSAALISLALALPALARLAGGRPRRAGAGATLAARFFYVEIGGPLMLVTWLAAAGVAFTLAGRPEPGNAGASTTS